MTDQAIAKRMSKARTKLLINQTWFGTLSLRLILEERTDIPTLMTDGTVLAYSPKFVESLSESELQFGVAHEVMHCAMLHMFRAKGRNMSKWNHAGDYAINLILKDAGFDLPKGVLYDTQYAGMSAEQIYARLPDEEDNGGHDFEPADGQPDKGDGSGSDGHDHGPANGPASMTESDWQIVAEQAAAVARKAGKMPGELDRLIGKTRESVVDWRALLRRFIENTVPSDYSWLTPNRRYIADGIYLPGVRKENTPRIAVAIDTSGSITPDMLNQFSAELTAIMYETRPEAIDVVYCDARVAGEESFFPDEGPVEMHAKGGGGTRFSPVFDWLAEQEEPHACLIYATDLESSDRPAEPDIPVMWLTPEWTTLSGPFGETIRMNHTS